MNFMSIYVNIYNCTSLISKILLLTTCKIFNIIIKSEIYNIILNDKFKK